MLNPLLERSSAELAPWLSSQDSAVDLVGDPSRRRMDSRRHIPIRLFGFPEILEAQEGGAFPSKGFQLLALLLRSPSRRLTRREAASFLWDSESDAESLINLRQLIHRIRKALPGNQGLITADARIIALAAEAAAIDLVTFEKLSQSDSPAEAIEGLLLFRGDLLEGVDDVTGTFSHWLECERTALRERFFTDASRALIELTRFGRAPESELRAIAERMLALDPERESNYRVLIEAYGRNGMIEEADRLFQSLIQMLKSEHGVPPAPETAAVARRVLAARSGGEMRFEPARSGMRFPRLAILAPGWTAAPGRTELLKVLIEDVANELARHRTFAVLAPHSSFQVDHDSGVPRKNGILRADYTVSGFVKPRGSGESLALRMVNCARQEIVWAAEFPISQSELMSSFRMLAIRISASLASGLETDMLLHLRKNGSGTAYLHYLEGQRWLKNCDLPRLRRARKAFGESISKDGRFAPAHARIAQTLYLEWLLLGGDDPRLLVDAREHAGLALALDPNNALGHWMAGVISLYQRDFDHSAEKFEEAEVLNPNSADLLVQHADALSHFGNAEAGWKKFERAIDLNPLPPDHYWWAGASIAFVQGDLARSIELCGRLKNDEPVLRLLAASHALAGNIEPARTYGKRLAELYPGQSAAQMFKIAPDRDSRVLNRFLEGLRLAGVK